jgi:DNA-binding NtrC family response regulator/pSer/pThr/pTyr-binding forkhead associated (FHA) protein
MAAPTVPAVAHAKLAGGIASNSGDYSLFVVGRDAQVSVPLPRSCAISIGRAESADVRIPDPQASRLHARLIVAEDGFRIEDLNSVNGTYVRDQRVPAGVSLPLGPGEAIGIGATLLTVQRNVPVFTTPGLVSHGQFDARLVEECARAETLRRSFALIRIDTAAVPASASIEAVLAHELRSGDVAAVYAPGRFEVLLADTEPSAVDGLVAQIRNAFASSEIQATMGIAICPADGCSPGRIFAKACARVRESRGERQERLGVVIKNPKVRELYEMAERAAAGTITVLIHGETGSGKEILAESIHTLSPRAKGPFVTLNCASLSESILESELFGHEKGAFTGATVARKGLFEVANGGTLLLDEVGEMSSAMQAKLLRVLETRQVLPMGATKPRPVDVRIVAASNRDLDEEVAAGRFRRDLFFRLNGILLSIPPLRKRTDEIEPIARLVLESVAAQMGRTAPDLDTCAIELLMQYPWPGNVRELRNTMERALLLCTGSTITAAHLPEERMRRSIDRERIPRPTPEAPEAAMEWRKRQADSEKQAMADALARCNGNRTRAAELLGMPRSTFMRKLSEYGLVATPVG